MLKYESTVPLYEAVTQLCHHLWAEGEILLDYVYISGGERFLSSAESIFIMFFQGHTIQTSHQMPEDVLHTHQHYISGKLLF